jgi:prolyl-tRNA editing enzyme YbaK/EbsC (Cys-tRNA(Pro) deacylase)
MNKGQDNRNLADKKTKACLPEQTTALSPSAARVQLALARHGLSLEVMELAQTTRTATDAARAVGCQVGQIVKSLVFCTRATRRPVLVVASGANRVSERAVAATMGEPVSLAEPEFVRTATGFAIGGVPPVGLASPMPVVIDEDLLQYAAIWAAAGNPNALFRLTPKQLMSLTDGRVMTVKADPAQPRC